MMKTKKENLSGIIYNSTFFAGILAGCGSADSNKESASKGGGSTTLTFFLMDNQSPAQMEGVKAVSAEIEKKSTTLRLKSKLVQAVQRVTTSLKLVSLLVICQI
ncbi:hypothetical protein GCM10020331_087320 [Ectobacillus funiculus]